MILELLKRIFGFRQHIDGLWQCNGRDRSQLDEALTGHRYHCPKCNVHLTSGLLCPKCGKRYDWPRLT